VTPDKLEGLRALAADMRTPDNEARTAALLYVRAGGRTVASAPTPPSAPRSTEHLERLLSEMETERDGWRARAKAADAIISRLVDDGRRHLAGETKSASGGVGATPDPFRGWNTNADPFWDFFRAAGPKPPR
jgi:hypothetical protein